MKKVNLIAVILCLMLAYDLYADEQSHRKSAEDLLLIMEVDKQMGARYEQLKNMQTEQLKAMGGGSQEAISFQNKMMDTMAEEMSWEKLKDDFISVYTEVFTEEELRGLIDFYKGPLGRKFIEKTPELTTKLMQISQKHSMQILPKIQAMTNEMVDGIKQKSQEPAPAQP
jgi:hypothetical protein